MTVRKALIGVDFATEREQRETNTQKASTRLQEYD